MRTAIAYRLISHSPEYTEHSVIALDQVQSYFKKYIPSYANDVRAELLGVATTCETPGCLSKHNKKFHVWYVDRDGERKCLFVNWEYVDLYLGSAVSA